MLTKRIPPMRTLFLCRRISGDVSRPAQPLNVLFFGSDTFSNFSLQALNELRQMNGNPVVGKIQVVTRSPKWCGRQKSVLKYPPIFDMASKLQLPRPITCDTKQDMLGAGRADQPPSGSWGRRPVQRDHRGLVREADSGGSGPRGAAGAECASIAAAETQGQCTDPACAAGGRLVHGSDCTDAAPGPVRPRRHRGTDAAAGHCCAAARGQGRPPTRGRRRSWPWPWSAPENRYSAGPAGRPRRPAAEADAVRAVIPSTEPCARTGHRRLRGQLRPPHNDRGQAHPLGARLCRRAA